MASFGEVPAGTKVAIWVVELADGPTVGAWLVDFDVDARAGRGALQTSSNPKDARRFGGPVEALTYWKRQSTVLPLRSGFDDRPNRPFTAYTIELRPLL